MIDYKCKVCGKTGRWIETPFYGMCRACFTAYQHELAAAGEPVVTTTIHMGTGVDRGHCLYQDIDGMHGTFWSIQSFLAGIYDMQIAEHVAPWRLARLRAIVGDTRYTGPTCPKCGRWLHDQPCCMASECAGEPELAEAAE